MTEKIKFNKNLSKKLSLDTMTDLGPSDTQGIEIKSPGKMHWLTIKGETWDDIQTVLTTELYDPDGELSDYIIQVEDKGLLEKILKRAAKENNSEFKIIEVDGVGEVFAIKITPEMLLPHKTHRKRGGLVYTPKSIIDIFEAA